MQLACSVLKCQPRFIDNLKMVTVLVYRLASLSTQALTYEKPHNDEGSVGRKEIHVYSIAI